MKDRLLGPIADRWTWFATALRVQDRVSEVRGGHLASTITLALFLSIFPLLLTAVAVIGFLATGNSDLSREVVNSLGVTGTAADTVVDAIGTAQDSRRAASVIGLVGLLWSGLGVVAAISAALDVVWQVRGRGIQDRLYGLLWLLGAILILAASLGTSIVINWVPVLAPASIAIGLLINAALWLWTFKALTNVDLPWRAFLPGAVLGAVGLEILKQVGTIWVPRAVASASALYGSIGVVFALLTWLFFFGRLVVYAAVLNVIRWEDDHGTVTVEIELPKTGDVVLEATRGGEAREAVTAG